MVWEANKMKWEHLSFSGDTVKVFFLVLVDVSKE